jgi:hypothetical protein
LVVLDFLTGFLAVVLDFLVGLGFAAGLGFSAGLGFGFLAGRLGLSAMPAFNNSLATMTVGLAP